MSVDSKSFANGETTKRLHEMDDDRPTSKKPRVRKSQFRGFYSYRKGERDEMQDAHVIMDDFSNHFTVSESTTAFYAIYDGHNGAKAAEFASEHLHINLAEKLPTGADIKTVEQAMKRALVESYRKTDDAFLVEARKAKPVLKDGSTATTVLVLNQTLFVANIGDSRAILCRFKPEENKEIALVLTRDHNPQIFEERMRIEKAGGSVKDGRILGILEVSRSLGDGQYKNHGVTCIPDIKKVTLTWNDRYFLIGCDGLWKTFSSQQVIEFVAQNIKEIKKDKKIMEMVTEDKSLEQIQWEILCSRLAGEAVRKGSGDNVTVVIVLIDLD